MKAFLAAVSIVKVIALFQLFRLAGFSLAESAAMWGAWGILEIARIVVNRKEIAVQCIELDRAVKEFRAIWNA